MFEGHVEHPPKITDTTFEVFLKLFPLEFPRNSVRHTRLADNAPFVYFSLQLFWICLHIGHPAFRSLKYLRTLEL